MKPRATELEWLTFFYQNVDLGPGEGDAMDALKARFVEMRGKNLPEGFQYQSDGESTFDKE